jgi:hypothetical protein
VALRGRCPLMLRTGAVCGTADHADLLVVELDRQRDVGDQDRDGLVLVDPSEGDFSGRRP